GLFGLSLECVAQCGMTTQSDGFTVPDPVAQCFTEIIQRAASDVRHLGRELDMGNQIDLASFDIHAITGVVKKYLRSLPDPVIPHAFHSPFLSAASGPCDVKTLGHLISTLPHLHRHLLCYILELTSSIQKHADVNMMNPEALAVVLAPVSTGLEQSLPIHQQPHGRRRGRMPKREEMDELIQRNAKWTYLWTMMIDHRDTLLQQHEQLERDSPSPVYPPFDIFMSQFEPVSTCTISDEDQDQKQQQHPDQWWRGLFSTAKSSDPTAWSSASAAPRRVLRRLASVSSMRPPSLHHWR
ncbi:Rho GTPase activation protein, partial [Fennellomyces sp. T-0311]